MATKITASLETAITPEDLTSQDHYLQFIPAKIHFNDKANIKPFFNDYILNKDGELSSVLRGRPLNGKIVEFKDHKAVIMKVPNTSNQIKADLMEDEDMSGEDGDNSHETVECRTMAKCDKMTVWNYDLPSDKGTDPVSKALLYANLAKILHSE